MRFIFHLALLLLKENFFYLLFHVFFFFFFFFFFSFFYAPPINRSGLIFLTCPFVHLFVCKNVYIGHIFSHEYTLWQDLSVRNKFNVMVRYYGPSFRKKGHCRGIPVLRTHFVYLDFEQKNSNFHLLKAFMVHFSTGQKD